MALKTRPDVFGGLDTGIAHHRDLPDEPAALVDHRHPGAAEQGDRRRQRVRARGRHPPGRRAQGGDHLRDHDAAVDRAARRTSSCSASTPAATRSASGSRSSASSSSGEDFQDAFQRFKDLADKKKTHLQRGPRGDRRATRSSRTDERFELGEPGACSRGTFAMPTATVELLDRRRADEGHRAGRRPGRRVFKAIAELTRHEERARAVPGEGDHRRHGRAGRGVGDGLRGRPPRDRPRRRTPTSSSRARAPT